ncbi:ADP-ribose glycohydrolase MACROD2 isoform X9 [Mus musculus]|uniref:ADP-ribose glycohydrolase MACROD2 isoform X9 n=1 Tax=Mus musculus TaxID=10090 RepID=UPI001677CDB4|nr:ADP-ribose glycohydrolase MACROD2 isoform X9 [Mus musculus]
MYPSNKKKKVWREEKERLLKMTLEERRKEYIRDYVSLSTILSWKEEMKSKGQNDEENTQEAPQMKKSLSEKVSLYRGDITLLEVDAIVNAANASLLGGGGDVIHTVGPIARGHINGSHKEDLANCYQSSLKLVKENNLRSVAFPCISTGIYGFPNEPAAVIALGTIKEWLAKNHQEVDRIIFCVFLEVDFKIYKKKMNEFFPVDDNNEGTDADMKEDSEGPEPKGLSPPHKKSKAKKPESSKDSSEDESGPEEKQTAEEMEGQSQEAGGLRFLLRNLLGLIHRDGVNTTPVPSPASEDKAEVHKDEDSAKDDNTVKDSDMTNHSVCDQELPNGQENDSAKSEGKTEAESPSSSMETEDLSPNQEDAAIVEQPEVIPLIDDQEAQEGGEAQGKDAPAVFAESQGSSEAENTSGPDVDMNSQVDGVNEPTESLQEDLQ